MLAAASARLSSQNQPDTLTAHFEYPSRTAVGPAIVVIEDVKLGPTLSILHLTLWQGEFLAQAPWIKPSASRRTVLAYTTHTNLRTFSGITLPTSYGVSPAVRLVPPPAIKAVETQGADEHWEESKLPMSKSSGLWRSLRNWRFYMPRGEPLIPGFLDIWIRTTSGERITQGMLPYVVDSFPWNMHAFLVAPELRQQFETPQDQAGGAGGKKKKRDTARDEQRAGLWFPTVLMNVEVKKALPPEGVDWLAVRVTIKQIKEGRFDLDVLVRDVEGEIVALSHHVAMILSIERNTAKRSTSTTKASL